MHYIIITNFTKIVTKCIDQEYKVIKGIYLLTIPQGCQIQLNNVTYFNEKSKTEGNLIPILQTDEYFKLIRNSKDKPIELQDLNINQDVKTKLQILQRNINYPRYEDDAVHATIWTIPIYVIIFIVIVTVYLRINVYMKKTTTITADVIKAPPPPIDANSKDGGVIYLPEMTTLPGTSTHKSNRYLTTDNLSL